MSRKVRSGTGRPDGLVPEKLEEANGKRHATLRTLNHVLVRMRGTAAPLCASCPLQEEQDMLQQWRSFRMACSRPTDIQRMLRFSGYLSFVQKIAALKKALKGSFMAFPISTKTRALENPFPGAKFNGINPMAVQGHNSKGNAPKEQF